MTQFYLVLPSNSSTKYFPNNTLTEYTTHLAKEIGLQGEWEVGLAEIQYPHAWYNITDSDEHHFSFSSDDGANWVNCRIDSGLYLTVEALLEAIQKSTPKELKKTRHKRTTYSPAIFLVGLKNFIEIPADFQIQSTPPRTPVQPPISTEPIKTAPVKTGEVTDVPPPGPAFDTKYRGGVVSLYVKEHCLVRLSEKMLYILGLNSGSAVFSHGLHKGVTDPNLDSITSLFVYSDICQYSLIGDASAPLLRIVQVKNDDERMVTKTFPHVYYTPVSKINLDTVEIYIRDDTGVQIPFAYGKLVVTLHFRKR